MRILGMLFIILIFSSQSQAASRFTGELQLMNDRENQLVNSSNGEEAWLSNGPVELVYQNPGMIGFLPLFTGQRQILVKQASQTVTFDLTSADFNGFGNFSTPAKEGVRQILAGETKKTIVRVQERPSSQSCSYSGYCMTCSTEMGFDGKLTSSCGLKFSNFCSGSEDTLAEFTDYSVSEVIILTESSSGKPLGKITRPPVIETKERTLKVTGSCS